MILNNIETAIYIACLLCSGVVIAMLFFRHIWRSLPIFCAYCIWDVLSNVGLYLANGHFEASLFFHIYFARAIIDSAFILCVLVELAWSVLRPMRASLPRSAMVLLGVLILVASAAIWPFAAVPAMAHATTREGLIFIQLQQTSWIVRILVFLVLAGASQLLSIGWRDRELQVATGFGLYAIVGLTVAILETHQTTALQYKRYDRIAAASYFCCLLYWAVSFAQKEAERREFTPQMRSFLLAAAGGARSTRVAMTESRKDKPPKQDER
jgi:hypothetical protein